MANKPVIVLNQSTGKLERLAVGDTATDVNGTAIGGGATAAGSTGEIQYKDAGGGLAASPYLSFEPIVGIFPQFSGGKLTLKGVDNAGTGFISTQFYQYNGRLEMTTPGKIVFTTGTGFQLFNNTGGALSNFSFDGVGGTIQCTNRIIIQTYAGALALFGNGGVSISTGTTGVIDCYAVSGTNVAGIGYNFKAGNSTGNQGSHLGFYTAAYGGTSGSTVRAETENFSMHGQNFGVGVTAPVAAIHVIKTTEQQRLGYDASNYWTATVGSTGLMTWQGVGAGSNLTISAPHGIILNGAVGRKVTTLSASTALDDTHCHVYVDTANVTITLPTAVGIVREYFIDNGSTGMITVNTTSSQTINGELTQTLSPNTCMDVYSNGANWRIF
jgi:hypothetical protein